jgi:HK97 family phage prohead protease
MTLKSKSPLGTKECRAFSMPDLRAIADGNVIDGHAAVFGQRVPIGNWFYEVIERGAFDKTDFKDVLFCINHDISKIPLARSRNNNANSTLQLSVDEQGLAIKAALDVERNAEAKALYSAVDRGDMGGMSFMFRVRGETWDDLDSDMPTRHITDIARVIEVTAASFPAYDGTDINARDQHGLESPAGVLESARSRLESQKSEETARQQELEVLRLRTQILSRE